MTKAILIDATARTISEVQISEPEMVTELQRLAGGYIEAAFCWRLSGDVLYVDEEGLLKDPKRGFLISVRRDQPLAGNGVIVGKEVVNEQGDLIRHNDPTMSLERLRPLVYFWEE